MANISLDWEVEGILSPEESVSAMLKVIPTKTIEQSGTFWTWDGKVRTPLFSFYRFDIKKGRRNILGNGSHISTHEDRRLPPGRGQGTGGSGVRPQDVIPG